MVSNTLIMDINTFKGIDNIRLAYVIQVEGKAQRVYFVAELLQPLQLPLLLPPTLLDHSLHILKAVYYLDAVHGLPHLGNLPEQHQQAVFPDQFFLGHMIDPLKSH